MPTRIRKAEPADAASFVSIKKQLPLQTANGAEGGGFLLGASEEMYRAYIGHALCLVTETPQGLTGFGIVFPDHMVRSSELWQKRDEVKWEVNLEPYLVKSICYFEQLAFLPGQKLWPSMLALQLAKQAFTQHDVLLTTTVRRPVLNRAALPFISTAGGFLAGNINERYPEAGEINSDIYLLEKETFIARMKDHPLWRKVSGL
jgi:hypothetical protein